MGKGKGKNGCGVPMNSVSAGAGWELSPDELAALEESLAAPPPPDMTSNPDPRQGALDLLNAIDSAPEEDREGIYNLFKGSEATPPGGTPHPASGSVLLFESSRLSTPPELAEEVRLFAASYPQLFIKGQEQVFASPEVNKRLVLMSDLEDYFMPAAAGSPALLEAWFESRVDDHTRALGIRSYSQGKLEILLPQGCLWQAG